MSIISDVKEGYINLEAVEPIMASDSYAESLTRIASSVCRKISQNDTEATVASVFENEIYFFMRSSLTLDVVFKKEVSDFGIRHSFKGRVDCLVNGLVIEYKRPSKLKNADDIEDAVSQLSDYLTQLASPGSEPEGILVDGLKAMFFYWQDSSLHHSEFSPLNRQVIDAVIRQVIGAGRKSFSVENVVSDFSLHNPLNPTYTLAQSLFDLLVNSPTQRTVMLYTEWLSLFHLSERDSGKNKDIAGRRNALTSFFGVDISDNDFDYKALFALQTCYAIVVKLFACKAIGEFFVNEGSGKEYFNDLAVADQDRLQRFLEGLEDGRIYRGNGVRNLLEDNFFSWYCSSSQWNSGLAAPICDIISIIRMYPEGISNIRTASVDIFKDLYMDFIPQEVRHSLGEYYTDSWLADCVTEKAIEKCDAQVPWRAIDPCCGSGVFLLRLIAKIIDGRDVRKMGDDEKSLLLRDVLERVSGIDINPLSALTARVNYFLAIKDLIAEGAEVEIPVYVGDSAVMATTVDLDGVECYSYTVNTQRAVINIVLPSSFVACSDFLPKMEYLQSFVRTGNAKLLENTLLGYFSEDCLNDLVRESVGCFCRQLVELHENDWDGIWVRIASNFMLVARISDRDIIVGNPPWVKWEYLPERYAVKLKESCLERHLFSGQHYMGAISLNVCAPIANMVASSWLTRGGVLGFIMPTNLLTQDSYEGFRRFCTPESIWGNRLYLQEVDLWDRIGKIFGKNSTEPCATFFYKFDEVDYESDGFAATRYARADRVPLSSINAWKNVLPHLREERLVGFQLDSERTGYTLIPDARKERMGEFRSIIGKSSYRGRTGVEFVPEEVTELDVVKSTRGEYFFRGVEKKAALHKLATYADVLLETDFIKPLVTGPEVKPFHIDWKGTYCLFPYRDGELECISIDDLSTLAPKTAQYLLDNKTLFNRQSERSKRYLRGNEFYALSKVGRYTFAEHMVLIRDNTTMCASVVEPLQTEWGSLSMPVPAKHAAIISTHADKEETFISEDEAYYLAGIFNTGLVRDYFKYTFSGRSYSIKFNFFLPLYNDQDERFVRIAELSRKCHELINVCEISDLVLEIENLYLSICQSK